MAYFFVRDHLFSLHLVLSECCYRDSSPRSLFSALSGAATLYLLFREKSGIFGINNLCNDVTSHDMVVKAISQSDWSSHYGSMC